MGVVEVLLRVFGTVIAQSTMEFTSLISIMNGLKGLHVWKPRREISAVELRSEVSAVRDSAVKFRSENLRSEGTAVKFCGEISALTEICALTEISALKNVTPNNTHLCLQWVWSLYILLNSAHLLVLELYAQYRRIVQMEESLF
jgi:hypothetical protein